MPISLGNFFGRLDSAGLYSAGPISATRQPARKNDRWNERRAGPCEEPAFLLLFWTRHCFRSGLVLDWDRQYLGFEYICAYCIPSSTAHLIVAYFLRVWATFFTFTSELEKAKNFRKSVELLLLAEKSGARSVWACNNSILSSTIWIYVFEAHFHSACNADKETCWCVWRSRISCS